MATTLHTENGTPDNLAEPPLDYSDPSDWHTGPLAPLDEETIPADRVSLTEAEIEEELFHAATSRARFVWEPSDQQQERALARIADAEFAPVSPERIAELNEQATVFYQAAYRGSWAQTYLTERLGGIDLTGDPRSRPGYAPETWTALTGHLRRHGATDDELLAAGLSKKASTGRLIDTFRNRLVLPISATDHNTTRHNAAADGQFRLQVVGFVARRNPDQDEVDSAEGSATVGPKYLNTGETVLFAKGEQLYGLAENTDRLAAGATPVIVEGPLDALAVSLASPGHVGVAPLGTALTDAQAEQLTPYLDLTGSGPSDGTGVRAGAGNGVDPVVATDADRAGQTAAERDYWILTARGADPRHIAFPAGHDPASLLRQDGPAALASRLTTAARPLADILVDERLNHLPPTEALPAAAAVVAAGRPGDWRTRISALARQLHLPVDVALTELIPPATRWDDDRHSASEHQIQNVRALRDRITAQAQLPDTERWAPLARQIDPRLVRAATWPPLADAFAEAARAGHDLPTLLHDVLTRRPLDPDNPGIDLQSRLLADLEPEPIDWRRPRQDRPVNTFADHQQPQRPTPPVTPEPSRPVRSPGR